MRIYDLPQSVKLPSNDEFICPVYMDHTDNVLRKIKICDIANMIVDALKDSSEVEMIQTSQGVKFRRPSSLPNV